MILFLLFRLVPRRRLHPEALRMLHPELVEGRAIVAEARKYRLLGRTGIVQTLDRQN